MPGPAECNTVFPIDLGKWNAFGNAMHSNSCFYVIRVGRVRCLFILTEGETGVKEGESICKTGGGGKLKRNCELLKMPILGWPHIENQWNDTQFVSHVPE